MVSWFGLGKLFGSNTPPTSSGDYEKVPDQLVNHLFGLIEQKSLVTEVALRYREATSLHGQARLNECISIYTVLERFVTEHVPPITKSELTVEELRTLLAAQYSIGELPDDFRLIFLPEHEQAVFLSIIASRELIKLLASSLGITTVKGIFDRVVAQTFLEGAVVTEQGVDVRPCLPAIANLSTQDCMAIFKLLNSALFQDISNSLGERSALQLTEKVYAGVKERYDNHLIARFLESLPLGVLESERATFLSKEDLGRKIQERTAELIIAQRELRGERDRATAIISSIGEGLITLDSRNHITSVNAAAEQLLGLQAIALIDCPWEEHITVEQQGQKPVNARFIERAITKHETVRTGLSDNILFTTKDKQIPVATIITPLSRNTHTGVVIVFRDITQEKEANAVIERTVIERTHQVQEARARLLASINSLKLGFLMTDPSLTVIIHNEAAEQLLNRKTEELTHSLLELNELFEGSLDLFASAQEVMRTQKAVDLDSIAKGQRFLRIYISPIAEKETAIGCAILIEDVTEARILERSRDEFFTIASHELRTPLIAIRGYASMIKEFYPDKIKPEDLIRMVDRIDTSGGRLITIVNSFLDMSRLEQGKMEFKRETFDLNEVIINTLEELRHVAEEKQVELVYKPSKAIELNADKNLTKQVIYNLVGNGIKFTQGGNVAVSVSSTEGKIRVTVKDTGIGMPESAQALLFHKFQQTGESLFTRDNSQGTGLGLYISKLIVEGMGGEIGLEASAPDKGSTFFFSLPQ